MVIIPKWLDFKQVGVVDIWGWWYCALSQFTYSYDKGGCITDVFEHAGNVSRFYAN